ncbi:MAG TPA: MauE/DoxX family redox-associated membrane protein, partial [Solirubrobacteraceae bacterium]|nr:MauE/DoxX family redox-associated membrane protein [Solirubrobacteraceae bacterium]
MGAALLACRIVLAAVFVVAGLAKLGDLEGSREAVRDFGVPGRFAGVVGGLLPVGELAVGISLLITPAARFGALGAAILLLAFIAAIGAAIAAGREPDCHCFGQVHSAPAGPRTLARNAGLLVVAGFVVIGGWRHPGVSATHWAAAVPAPWLVAIAAGVIIAALISFQVWFSLQLLDQNGRTISRLTELEGALALLTGGGAEGGLAQEDETLGAGLSGAGLPVGSPAPEFVLSDVDGGRHSLASLRADTEPGALLLVFSDAACGPCESLMPEVAAWQRRGAGALATVVIAAGDRDANRAKARDHGLGLVLLQEQREVAELYQALGTP